MQTEAEKAAKLRRAHAAIAELCCTIEDLFMPGAKVTVVVTNPGYGDADVLVTNGCDRARQNQTRIKVGGLMEGAPFPYFSSAVVQCSQCGAQAECATYFVDRGAPAPRPTLPAGWTEYVDNQGHHGIGCLCPKHRAVVRIVDIAVDDGQLSK